MHVVYILTASLTGISQDCQNKVSLAAAIRNGITKWRRYYLYDAAMEDADRGRFHCVV